MNTLLLTRAEIAALMTPQDYLEGVEAAFRASHAGQALSPPPMHVPAVGGGFHAKGAALLGDRKVVALKLNGNFPGNPARGLPTIQGAILLADAENGALLAILDSIEITLRRTAAASALAARHLATPDANALAIIGCGAQAMAQAEAIADVRNIRRGLAFDADATRAQAFAAAASAKLGAAFDVTPSMRAATIEADIIVTCTTATSPFLDVGDVKPGAFVAAVGADNPDKSEIAPALMAQSVVVTDVLEQCLAMGDLHHAIKSGLMSGPDVFTDLAAVAAGAAPPLEPGHRVVIFDSTGTGLQDVASALVAYDRARARGIGTNIGFA